MISTMLDPIAEVYGVNEALLISKFDTWLSKNKANGHNVYEGRVWTYNTLEGLSKLCAYWSTDQINRLIRKLVNDGILEKAHLSKNGTGRTNWYTFTDSFIKRWKHLLGFANLHLAKSPNEQQQGIQEDNSPESPVNTDLAKSPNEPENSTTIPYNKKNIITKSNNIKKEQRQPLPSFDTFNSKEEIFDTLKQQATEWKDSVAVRNEVKPVDYDYWFEKFADEKFSEGYYAQTINKLKFDYKKWLEGQRTSYVTIGDGDNAVRYYMQRDYKQMLKVTSQDNIKYFSFVMYIHGYNTEQYYYTKCADMTALTPADFDTLLNHVSYEDLIDCLEAIENDSKYNNKNLFLTLKRLTKYARK